MTEKIYENPEIYKIDVPLPNNPLKNLNCYVVKTKEKNLVIDTGFNQPECLKALREGLEELNLDLTKTELFLTHLHADHTGLAGDILPEGGKMYLSEDDASYLAKTLVQDPQKNEIWKASDRRFEKEGFPKEALPLLHSTNPAKAYTLKKMIPVTTVLDGDKIKVGDYTFTCIFTPGHTPGHMCLYLDSEKLIFLGDHVLFDITPNITNWQGVKDSLRDYLKSLEKVEKLSIKTALPAHRKNEMDVYVRIEEIKHHHALRLQNILDILGEKGGQNAHDIASKMKWSMRGKDWSEFPMHQKWFAVGETIAHLDYLLEEGKIKKEQKEDIFVYDLV